MKKLLAMCLAICMVIGMLAGCFNDQDVSGNVSALEKDETSATSAPTKEAEAVATEAPTAEATQAPEQENLISFGRMDGGVYTNTYAGFGCTLDEKWSFSSATELQELPETVKEMYKDTEAGEIADQYSTIYDMSAENATDLTSMNVIYTKLGLQERLTFLTMSEEDVVDSMLSNLDMMLEAYQAAGFENISVEKVRATFLGEEHFALRTTATVQGTPYYILQVIDYSRGSYGVTLTVACFVEDVTDTLLALFYEV